MLYKPAPGSTTWVLAAILLQNITKSLLGWCFNDDAWYFLLGWRLIQLFLALGYLSTAQAMLQCLCSALPPVLCAHSWSHLTWEGAQAFLLAAVFGQDCSGLRETSCFFCSNSVFTCQGWEQGVVWRGWSLWRERDLPLCLWDPEPSTWPAGHNPGWLYGFPTFWMGNLTTIQEFLFGFITVSFPDFDPPNGSSTSWAKPLLSSDYP